MVVGSARRGRVEREMWCICWSLEGAVEDSVREEVDRRVARAVDALRRAALDGAIVDV